MTRRKTIAIFLDGYEHSLERSMAASGELPHLSALAARSARFVLDDGGARLSELNGEHVSSGLAPAQSGRHGSVHFDTLSYGVCAAGAMFKPFAASLSSHTVVFDMPYFNHAAAPNVSGIGGWGSHSPGAPPSFSSETLRGEFARAIGDYPATPWIYGFAWPSADKCRAMGSALAAAVDVRTRASRWLLQKTPDWQFALIGVSEAHSVVEGLWHGIDANHPLHGEPSASVAGEGVRAVYRAIDRLVGALVTDYPDAQIVVFSTHGMGSNHSDVATMLLLPELLHRFAFGKPLFQSPASWSDPACAVNAVARCGGWSAAMRKQFAWSTPGVLHARLRRHGPAWLGRYLTRQASQELAALGSLVGAAQHESIDWIPSTLYRPWWKKMSAFALPSFSDGRIRINLMGREAQGRVALQDYAKTVNAVANLLRECRDGETGKSIVSDIEMPHLGDPLAAGPADSDLLIGWQGAPRSIEHPKLGVVGPVPLRRTGGHTSPFGFAYVSTKRLAPGDHGTRSSFDVVPTLIELLGERVPAAISGKSLLEREPGSG